MVVDSLEDILTIYSKKKRNIDKDNIQCEIEIYNQLKKDMKQLTLEYSVENDIEICDIDINSNSYSFEIEINKHSTHENINKTIIKNAIKNEKLLNKNSNLEPHKMNSIILYSDMKNMVDKFKIILYARYLLERSSNCMDLENSYEFFIN